jgi:hypothetical protein
LLDARRALQSTGAGALRLPFKGGTSLSRGFHLIERFSEDIHITFFLEDIGPAATVEELEGLSGKKRTARLGAAKMAMPPKGLISD